MKTLIEDFFKRNETFKGKVSIIGHSLGSLIVFDILSHQTPFDVTIGTEKDAEKTLVVGQSMTTSKEQTLEQVQKPKI